MITTSTTGQLCGLDPRASRPPPPLRIVPSEVGVKRTTLLTSRVRQGCTCSLKTLILVSRHLQDMKNGLGLGLGLVKKSYLRLWSAVVDEERMRPDQ